MKKLYKFSAVILLLLTVFKFNLTVSAAGDGADIAYFENENTREVSANKNEVYLGGIPFGVKMYSSELTVIGFSDVDAERGSKSPAYDAGIRENDTILSVNSEKISSVNDLIDACENCGGKRITIECKRNGKNVSFSFVPSLSKSENKYKTGMWIKDSTAGIGTVTYIVPETKAFAGLGHGICSSRTGEIEKLTKGVVMSVDITGVEKGSEGTPGELIGKFNDDKTGTLISNTDDGVYGIFSEIPDTITKEDLIKIAGDGEAEEGDAFIRCTLAGNSTDNYKIKLLNINEKEDNNKNFIIEVTDKRLIDQSGGIVQGMSGSPIIQNGKLVGAVTHVFVNDPTKGYGISIGEMEKSMPDILT